MCCHGERRAVPDFCPRSEVSNFGRFTASRCVSVKPNDRAARRLPAFTGDGCTLVRRDAEERHQCSWRSGAQPALGAPGLPNPQAESPAALLALASVSNWYAPVSGGAETRPTHCVMQGSLMPGITYVSHTLRATQRARAASCLKRDVGRRCVPARKPPDKAFRKPANLPRERLMGKATWEGEARAGSGGDSRRKANRSRNSRS